MKIYLDDERPAPPGWVRVDNTLDCIIVMSRCFDLIDEMSLDHDLGGASPPGYEVLRWLEGHARYYVGKMPPLPKITIHSANPPARDRMLAAVAAIEEIWST